MDNKILKKETCYMCDELATTKEHVPPKCLFPEAKDIQDKTKNYRIELITVPSCPKHNNDKSNDDEYLLNILSMSIFSTGIGANQYWTKVQRAWKRKPALRQEIAKNLTSTNIPMKLGVATDIAGALTIDRHRLITIFKQYARGLFFYEYGKKFLGELDVGPLFLVSNNINTSAEIIKINNMLSQAYRNVEFKGKNPEVFRYSFLGDVEGGESILKMEFYQGVSVLVFFNR